MLNPITIAERALGLGGRLAAGAVDLGRRALGSSDVPAPGPAQDSEGPDNTAAGAPERQQAAPKPEITDTALARKVESEIFRGTRGAKSKVSVNAVGRVVHLRGEAKTPELIKELEARTAAIPEVQRVENLLHLPKTPSPTRSDTPARQRKTKTTKGKPPSSQRRRINSGKNPEGAEPTPKELAKEDRGRQPAPLGSKETSKTRAKKGKGS
ncbi:MAG TPA: BON domain-containing protein [Thermoleophilaceae bacterium]|nr:BON domain-containing protein [Thermoleophilaceae bacterium]